MEKTTLKYSFAHTITELDNKLPKGMTDCERYGIPGGAILTALCYKGENVN